jgi:hypothetical protein
VVEHLIKMAKGYLRVGLLIVPAQSVIIRLPNSLSHVEESMTGHMGVKGSMVRPKWNLPAERACFSFSGTFNTYANRWGGGNQVIPIR